jgi:peroxin-19
LRFIIAAMEAPDEDLDAILNSTLEDMEKAEKQMPPRTPTPASVPATPTATPAAGPPSDKNMEAFTEQLSKLMLDMSKGNGDPEKLLEDLMKQVEAPEPSPSPPTPGAPSPSPGADPVQENLMRTISSLAESAQKLSRDPSQPAGPNDEAMLNQMMEQFAHDPSLQGLMEGMMQQLLGKDLLYNPMKELRDKYVIYLEHHQTTIPAAEGEKYRKQLEYIKQICIVYETDEKNTQKIAQLMQEMQEHGQPPPELLKDLGGDETGENSLQTLLGGGGGGDGKNPNCLVM